MKKLLLIFIVLFAGCAQTQQIIIPELQELGSIPETADIIFTSVNHLISNSACLEDGRVLKERFVTDAECNALIYGIRDTQIFTLDVETKSIQQITNGDCIFTGAQVINNTSIMINAMCEDTNSDGVISASVGGSNDESELYLMDLETRIMNCLTCGSGLTSINNPDYSHVQEKIVFSASSGGWGNNHLYTIDLQGELEQLTSDNEYLEFDCSWSEDGALIVSSRLPRQDYPFTIPSEVWLMNNDGTNLRQITSGGLNPTGEIGSIYPIGTDADPDFSPDNTRIVFSRFKTETENVPIGVWELIIINVDTLEEEIIDSSYANMIPEWKSEGIAFIRQESNPDYMSDPMSVKQSIYSYNEGSFTELEEYPYNVFPMGGSSVSWIN